MQEPRPFSIRPYREGDEHGILHLFNTVFALGNPDFVPRSLEHWQWAFRDNPLGHQTFVAESQDRIVGQYTAIPAQWRMPYGVQLGAQALDTCVALEHRRSLKKSGLFLQLAGEWFDHYGCPERDHIVYGFPNPQAFRIGTRLLDYRPVHCPVREWSLPLSATESWGGGDAVHVQAVDRFGEEVDDFDEHLARPMSWVRDSASLNWRYASCPTTRYHILRAESAAGDLRGFLVVTLGWHGDRKNLVPLVDWLVEPGDHAAWRALLVAAAELAREHSAAIAPLDTFLAWVPPGHGHREDLQKLGFTAADSRFHLCIRVFHPELSVHYAEDHWYVLMGDSDIY